MDTQLNHPASTSDWEAKEPLIWNNFLKSEDGHTANCMQNISQAFRSPSFVLVDWTRENALRPADWEMRMSLGSV